jgi:hypothetical protein
MLVMTISLCIMHGQTWRGAGDLMPMLNALYDEWAGSIDEMKPSELRNTLLRKRERYNRVLAHNRNKM